MLQSQKMKYLFLIIASVTLSSICGAQSFQGTWEGRLQIPSALRLAFFLKSLPDGHMSATWQSPDQTKLILSTDTCFVHQDSIFLLAKKFKVSFKGRILGDSAIEGIFTQGIDIPLQLKKVQKLTELKRPQTPVAPFTYNSQNVSFYNADKTIRYGGTLTYPKEDSGFSYFRAPVYPAILLISGSGPQDRDETLFGHKPFAVLADFLTKRGFAVLRVDDRGVGASSGNFASATTADFADDAAAAIDFLKAQSQTDTGHITLIGHSEGGMIAPMLASRRTDVHGLVLLAAPGVPIIQLMQEQIEAVALSSKASPKLIQAEKDLFMLQAKELLKNADTNVIKKNTLLQIEKWAASQDSSLLRELSFTSSAEISTYVEVQTRAMNTPWYRYFLGFKPSQYMSKLDCNVLALNGSKDIQVLAASNLAGIKASLKKSKHSQRDVVEIAGLNHLFQNCQSCTVTEYATLEETFSQAALDLIGNWLLSYGR